MTDLCVVHLARRRNGPAPLRAFVESYRARPAGAPHRLVLAMKGFGGVVDAGTERVLDGLAHERVLLPDAGRDIAAYRSAARELGAGRICFLNSFSVLLHDGWLAHLSAALADSRVGIAGASGSWQSLAANHRWLRAERFRSALDPLRWAWRELRYRVQWQKAFPEFPNPHVRSNGFLMRSDVFLRYAVGPFRTRMDGYRFESGVRGLSRRIVADGLELRLVGADGLAHRSEAWPAARIFWSDGQQNLMIADNQTRLYADADAGMRQRLSRFAWGPAS